MSAEEVGFQVVSGGVNTLANGTRCSAQVRFHYGEDLTTQ